MAHRYDQKTLLARAENTFSEFLDASGMRKTPERMQILRAAFGMKAHFGVDQLYQLMEESGYHVSRATVYNTVDLLTRSGLLRRHLFETHQARYEVAGKNHFHLVCTSCGRITEADDRLAAKLLDSIDTRGFSPAYFSGTVYGLCSSCFRKSRKAQSTPKNHPDPLQRPKAIPKPSPQK